MLSYIIYRNDKGCTSQERTYMRAMSADVPVISIKQPLSGSCNIKYDSETALANIIRHVI